jgi:hypothetical protein
VIDLFNGTEQELNTTPHGSDTVLRGILVKDYPTLIRVAPGQGAKGNRPAS